MGRFAGKVAIVTGASSGIGAAVARRLGEEGAKAVVPVDVHAERPVDVADAVQVDRLVDSVVTEHGALDVVVHAAGVDDGWAKERLAEAVAGGDPVDVLSRLPDEVWRRMVSVNLDGTFHVLRAALRVMLPRRSGAIVTIGSDSAFVSPVGYGHYAAAKAGAHALCQAAAKEAIAFGVRVNTVAPGPTETGMAARTPEVLRRQLGGRYASPDEVANVALFLASEEASDVVGAVLLCNGGRFTA
jgi:NAD(P)-dependent dehydrogenase (short-subunit alcohol dehydrogenase family)